MKKIKNKNVACIPINLDCGEPKEGMIMKKNYGLVRVAAAVPVIEVANPEANAKNSIRLLREARGKDIQLMVFPELNLTGYTCGDLFHQLTLQNAAKEALEWFLVETTHVNCMAIVGLPLRVDDQLFNVAAICYNGRVLAFIPKSYLPNYKEFYETRWFAPASRLLSKEVDFLGKKVPIGIDIVINTNIPGFSLAVEICEDLFMPIPPSSHAAVQGATIIANPSASNGLVGKADYRRELVNQQSARCVAAYVYASCGYGESTSDVVFDGHAMIAENGSLLKESERYSMNDQLIISDVDVERLSRERAMSGSFGQSVAEENFSFRKIEVDDIAALNFRKGSKPERYVDPHPFIPSDPAKLDERCHEVFQIQTFGLMRRLKHVNSKKVSIGVSGGLDSTLALIVTCWAFDKLGWDRKGIIAVTMPGFGTDDRTYKNAVSMIKQLGVTFREISIVESTLLHLKEIGHDRSADNHPSSCLTCQNSQARERTQILMDLGFVIGTGDLSEATIAWCTYNGDQMSMYNVNSGVPKTLVKYIVEWTAEKNLLGKKVAKTLLDIVATPISPGLDPLGADGAIEQKTEDLIGPYELHDFFLFQMMRNGFEPEKILFFTEVAFSGIYDSKTIKKWLEVFYTRFFFGQFKRDPMPNGMKVGSVALSPRGDWRMPSDINGKLWIEKVKIL